MRCLLSCLQYPDEFVWLKGQGKKGQPESKAARCHSAERRDIYNLCIPDGSKLSKKVKKLLCSHVVAVPNFTVSSYHPRMIDMVVGRLDFRKNVLQVLDEENPKFKARKIRNIDLH